eukprot:TRINITY_DN977_c0_g1_i16.p1 TRINITY_DN977_c0_g1~~TRINITY_DN977_c0_g1_i16.p1  ORF type:complete len:108 (+),score=21.15 TRINITY_DN977_c0_g1_i16:3-326(+)
MGEEFVKLDTCATPRPQGDAAAAVWICPASVGDFASVGNATAAATAAKVKRRWQTRIRFIAVSCSRINFSFELRIKKQQHLFSVRRGLADLGFVHSHSEEQDQKKTM